MAALVVCPDCEPSSVMAASGTALPPPSVRVPEMVNVAGCPPGAVQLSLKEPVSLLQPLTMMR